MKNSAHYKAGSKNEIAVILSCPGKDEASATPPEPAKGQTGKNLETILGILTNDYGHSGFTRDEICITNAWDQVEYSNGAGNTGRSEATILEILNARNLDRLANEINKIEKIIICCGINAEAAILALLYADKICLSVKIITINHLANRSLNSSIKYALDGSEIKHYFYAKDKPADETRSLETIQNDNRLLRLQVVAKKIHDLITK